MDTPSWVELFPAGLRGVRALVTGGAGFIGSHLAEALLELGADVVVLDDLSSGDRANLEPFSTVAGRRFEFVEGSLLDGALVRRCAKGCRWVFHEAALASVPRSIEDPVRYHQVNVTGTLEVLEAARAAKVQRVMFAASSSAYGDSLVLPKVETMAVLPKSPYAANKVACEALMRAYSGSYGLDTVALRYFNIFGPRQNASSPYTGVIAIFAKALIAGKNLTIDGDGEQSRDFTFIANAVYANLLAAQAAKPLGGEVINVAVGERVTINELADKMAKLMGQNDLRPAHGPDRAGDVKHSVADITRAAEMLDYSPIVDFASGLKPTVEWYKATLGGA